MALVHATFSALRTGKYTISVKDPKDGKKAGEGDATFFYTRINYVNSQGAQSACGYVWFGRPNVEAIPTRGARVYTAKGGRPKGNEKYATVSIRDDSAPGLFSFCQTLHNTVRDWTIAHATELRIALPLQDRDFHGPIVSTYSLKNEDLTRAGKPLEHPLARLHIGLGTYPDKHPQAGQRVSVIWDWKTRKQVRNSEGRLVDRYDEATDAKGHTMTAMNISDVFRNGDIIRRMVLTTDSVSKSNYGISARVLISQVWIEHASSFDGEPDMTEDERAVQPPAVPDIEEAAPTVAASATVADQDPITPIPDIPHIQPSASSVQPGDIAPTSTNHSDDDQCDDQDDYSGAYDEEEEQPRPAVIIPPRAPQPAARTTRAPAQRRK